jgi:hypothetical protein
MSIQTGQSEQSDIARHILSYLVEHPQAQDTLEGILHWWLLEQQIKRWTPRVREALDELIAQGWVRERKGRDGQVHYRVNRRKIGRIRAALERIEAQPERISTKKRTHKIEGE